MGMATKRRKEAQRKGDKVFVHLMPLGGYSFDKEQVKDGSLRNAKW
jgi:hypothetical protein